MRSLNWSNITATSDDGYSRIEAGPYVARITKFEDNPMREYIEVVFDIAEGKNAGFWANDKDHDYTHHFFLSYKEKAQGMLKGRLEAIAASNPGFDPFAAWDAGRTDMFVGRFVGVNIQEEEYEASDGSLKTRMNVCQVVDAQKVRDGSIKTRDIKRLAQKGSQAPTAAPIQPYTGDLPFD